MRSLNRNSMGSFVEYIKKIRDDGYCFIPDLIPNNQCEEYKHLLEDHYAKYGTLYVDSGESAQESLANKRGEKVVFNLHNKCYSWFELFENPLVLEILDAVLNEGSYNSSEGYYLNNISARSPLKGHPGQQLHIDGNLPGSNYVLIMNVLWLLDDFTLENGATRIVPGSHKRAGYPENGAHYPDEVRITGKKGGALLFNANIWHGGAESFSSDSRWAVALGYARWFIKPSFDFTKNTPNSIYSRMTIRQKELLGFHLTPPSDEFTRLRRKSSLFETPLPYDLPGIAGDSKL